MAVKCGSAEACLILKGASGRVSFAKLWPTLGSIIQLLSPPSVFGSSANFGPPAAAAFERSCMAIHLGVTRDPGQKRPLFEETPVFCNRCEYLITFLLPCMSSPAIAHS
jgi:hypothetical protein